jgi:Zn finger protein HypA/HybF involved in hydrogenase expression
MSIAVEIYRVCREAVKDHGPGRIERVRVAVGELSAVEPDLLDFAWQALTTDTGDAGSEFEAIWCPARQYCASCDADKPRAEGSWLRLCPDCGLPLQVSGGDELDVIELTYIADDEDEPS